MNRRLTLLQLWFAFFNFALATPSVYLLIGLPLVMRQHGWSGTEIGLFQLTGLPALLKFALALPVQQWRMGGMHYRGWALLTGLALVVVMLGLSWQPRLDQRSLLFALAMVASLLATWADIPLNALAIRLLPADEHPRAGSFRASALFLAAVTGGGLLLLAQDRWGWALPFMLMAALIVLALLPLLCLRESAVSPVPILRNRWTFSAALTYFRQPQITGWLVLLTLSFPFVGAVWLYLKPMMLDAGVPAPTIAVVLGMGGGVLGALTSLLGEPLRRYLGLRKALLLTLWTATVSLSALSLMLGRPASATLLMLTTIPLIVAMAMLSALLFGLMMRFTRPDRQAADYGLQSSLFVLTRLLVAATAGVLLDKLEAQGLVAVMALATGVVCLLAHRISLAVFRGAAS